MALPLPQTHFPSHFGRDKHDVNRAREHPKPNSFRQNSCASKTTHRCLNPNNLNRVINVSDFSVTPNPMSSPRAAGNDGDNREAAVAKTAGFVVFSGIAMSILKALNPLNKNKHEPTQPLSESTRPSPPPPPQPIAKLEPSTCTDQSEPQLTSRRTIDIVKGDTLWGLSRKYGVSIDAIKEANGLSGDTIYAGKKLVIP